ncbi:hypothetical protein ACN42_g5391, partial [Penicillium freii]
GGGIIVISLSLFFFWNWFDIRLHHSGVGVIGGVSFMIYCLISYDLCCRQLVEKMRDVLCKSCQGSFHWPGCQ